MRGVLRGVSAGATGRILDSADPGEIRTYQKATVRTKRFSQPEIKLLYNI